jgi:hypothetical protein
MRRLALLVAVVLAVTASVVGTGPPPASAATDDAAAAQVFLGRINGLRSQHGVQGLQPLGQLTAGAQQWTAHMAATQQLAHDPNPTPSLVGVSWTQFGENVGYGGTLDWLWQGFLDSPGHLQTLLHPGYTHVGVSVVTDSTGKIWTTHRFATVAASPPVTAPPATAPPATVPPPTAPPATFPPATIPPVTAPPVTAPVTVPPPTTVADPEPVRTADPGRAGSVLEALRRLPS